MQTVKINGMLVINVKYLRYKLTLMCCLTNNTMKTLEVGR